MVNKWALLCGGDFYLPPKPVSDEKGKPRPAPRNLQGCVRDVQSMREVLVKSGVPPKNIKMLTARPGQNPDQPQERRKHWPIWENIKRELDSILTKASEQDLVYFHYSGHGSMRQDIEEDFIDNDGIRSGTALVMTDVYQGGPYLTGRHLGTWIEGMVREKSLRVTVVLDSCHSGAAFRYADDPDVRTLEWLPGRQVDMDADAECDAQANDSTRNPGEVRSCWLSNPTGCTILTACGSGEVAVERRFGEHKQGVLTHHLVKLLELSGGRPPSHQRAVDYVRRNIRGQRQNPSAYGDVLFEFFGDCEYSTGETCNATLIHENSIDLNIGRAQGVAVGAQYGISPSEGSVEPDGHPLVKVTITAVANFRSKAEFSEGCNLPDWPRDEIRRAHLIQWALETHVSIRTPDMQSEQREKLERELQRTPGLRLSVEQKPQQQSMDLVVKVDQENAYEIRQNDRVLPRLPRISVLDELWATKLARVLSHVARYQELRRKFSSTATSQRLGRFAISATPDQVESGEDVELSLSYAGNEPLSKLCVSLYCFSDSWVIYKLHPGPGLAADREFWDQYCDGMSVTMEFPVKVNDTDPDEVDDLFVFFVATSNSSGTPSWGDISLPPLELRASRSRREWHAPEDDENWRHKLSTTREPDLMWTTVETLVRTTGTPR